MQKIALLLLGLTSSLVSWAQLTPVGEWNNYLPFRNIVGIAESQERIYSISETGVFYYDKEDASVQRLSAVQGLYDVNITAIGGSPDKSTILLGYEDGAIDIIIGNKVITKLDITRGSVIGEKRFTISIFTIRSVLSALVLASWSSIIAKKNSMKHITSVPMEAM